MTSDKDIRFKKELESRSIELPDQAGRKTLVLQDDQAFELAETSGKDIHEIYTGALEKGITPYRYIRNRNSISTQDQLVLFKSHVSVIGAGGLGGQVILNLTRIGIGHITIVDHDVFDENNMYNLENFQKHCGPDHYWFAWGNAACVVINDAVGIQTAYNYSMWQYRWLEDTLRKLRGNFAHIFVFMHIPPFDPREGESYCLLESEGKRFMRIMEKFEIDYVFCGHIHCYFRQVINEVTYIISGGAGATLKCSDGFYHYVQVSVRGDKIVDSLVKVKKDWWLELTGDIQYYVHIMRSFLRPFQNVMRSNPSSIFSPTD